MNKLDEARAALMEAVKTYHQAAGEAAAQCVSFRDKYNHWRNVESTLVEVERMLVDINDLSEEADLCNITCPRYKQGDCAFNLKHEQCPRYAERLNTDEA